MSEDTRFEALKKYMCKWSDAVDLSVCRRIIEKKEIDDVDCLLCLTTSFIESFGPCMDIVITKGTGNLEQTRIIGRLISQCIKTERAFNRLAIKLKPEYGTEERNLWCDVVEREVLERERS